MLRQPPSSPRSATLLPATTVFRFKLTLPTFHVGGAAQLNEQSNLDAVADAHLEYRHMPTVKDSRGRRLSLARNGELAIIDKEGRERAVHRLPYGAQLMHDEDRKSTRLNSSH